MDTEGKDETYLPLSEIVYRRIRRLILRSGPAQRLSLTENDLANRFRVSKTPVREALRRLAQEGLVVTNPHRGAKVVGLTKADLEEIYLMRSRLESLAARIAAERLTAEDAAEFHALIAELKVQTAAGSTEDIHRLNVRLHELIWRTSRTRRLTQILSNLQDYVEMSRSTMLSVPKGGETLLDEHARVVQAILDKDSDRAEAAMVQHIAYMVNELRAGMRVEAEG
ncbi:MAG TPA: GntR family transcriptional regulator [Candidatus Sulfotelmatobacter sp.]|nr:GntR family transcriptional regulator [Candidatus Sulfotelmatobacter sp.]